jgi:hypothetical protein
MPKSDQVFEQFVWLEWLLPSDHAGELSWDLIGTVAGREHERNPSLLQSLGNTKGQASPQIDIDDGDVEPAICEQIKRLVQIANERDNVRAERFESYLQIGGEKPFVLHN